MHLLQPETIALIIIIIWLLITFLCSFIEKVFDIKGTKAFFKAHFEDSFIRLYTTPLLFILIGLEIIAVLLLLFGLYTYLFSNENYYLLLGLIVVSLSFVSMLIGQRIAKDYQGATSLTIYMIITVIGFCLLH